MVDQQQVEVSPKEAVKLGATDSIFFARYFFPRAFRQRAAKIHQDVWNLLEDRENRFVSMQMFRESAKTTTLRAYAAKRIAYGISRTILVIGSSQDDALRTVDWIKQAVEQNRLFAGSFGLKKGSKWQAEEAKIYHPYLDEEITVLGVGIDGSIRGINVQDYRPDLIILDDVISEDNARTVEQRKKTNDIVFGAIVRSLESPADNPLAKLVMLQTPLDQDDASELTQNDPQWAAIRVSCFDESGNSVWPERHPTDQLKLEKESYINRNMLSLWMREMECRVIADESRYFRPGWLARYNYLPEKLTIAVSVDPSPPRDEEPEKRKTKDPDPEAVSAVAYDGDGNPYLLEQTIINDPNPEATWSEVSRMRLRWKPVVVALETVNYQKTLQWYFNRRMKEEGIYFRIQTYDSKRTKTKRVRQTFTSLPGILYLPPGECEDFKEQYVNYPEVRHDDAVDSASIGFEVLSQFRAQGGGVSDPEDESEIEDLGDWRGAP